MKYHIRILALGLTLTYLLAGCGKTTSGTSSVSVAEPESFGVDHIGDTPEEMAETTGAEETSAVDSALDASAESSGSSVEQEAARDLTQLAVKSALCAEYIDGLSYDGADPVYFWRALGYLIGLVGEQSPAVSMEGDLLKLAAEDVDPFVTALFGTYDAQYPSLGEENPLVASEYGEQGEVYAVSQWDLSAMEVTMTEPEDQGDGTYRCQAELSENGTPVCSYTVTLEDDTVQEGQTPLFAYSIIGLTENTD